MLCCVACGLLLRLFGPPPAACPQNKSDLLESKMSRGGGGGGSALAAAFPEYAGGDDATAALAFIKRQFEAHQVSLEVRLRAGWWETRVVRARCFAGAVPSRLLVSSNSPCCCAAAVALPLPCSRGASPRTLCAPKMPRACGPRSRAWLSRWRPTPLAPLRDAPACSPAWARSSCSAFRPSSLRLSPTPARCLRFRFAFRFAFACVRSCFCFLLLCFLLSSLSSYTSSMFIDLPQSHLSLFNILHIIILSRDQSKKPATAAAAPWPAVASL